MQQYIRLIALLACMCGTSRYAHGTGLTLYSDISADIPRDTMQAQREECSGLKDKLYLCRLRYTAGARLSSRYVNLAAYSGIPFTTFGSIKHDKTAALAEQMQDRLKFGAELGPQALRLKAGHLSTGNAFAKLKNPSLSLPVSPVSNGSLPLYGGKLSLPSSAAKDAPLYYGMELHSLADVCGFYKEGGDFALSIAKQLSFSKTQKLAFSLSGGRFHLVPKTKDSWFFDNRYFIEGDYAALLAEAKFTMRGLGVYAASGLYQNPAGGMRSWYRAQASADWRMLSVAAGVFHADGGLVLSDSSINNTLRQMYVNPKIRLVIRPHFLEAPLLLRTGVMGAVYTKQSSDRYKMPYTQGRLSAGAELSYKKTALSFRATSAGIPIDTGDLSASKTDAESFSTRTQVSTVIFSRTRVAMSFSTDSGTDSRKFTLSLSPGCRTPMTFSLTESGDAFSVSYNARINAKHMALILKLAVQTEYAE